MGGAVSVAQKCLSSVTAPCDLLNKRVIHYIHIVDNNPAARELFTLYLDSPDWIHEMLKKDRQCYRLPPPSADGGDASVVTCTANSNGHYNPPSIVANGVTLAPSDDTEDGFGDASLVNDSKSVALSPLILFTAFTHFVHSDLFCGWMMYNYYGDAVNILDKIKWVPGDLDSELSTCISSLHDYSAYKRSMKNSLSDHSKCLNRRINGKQRLTNVVLRGITASIDESPVGVCVLRGHDILAPCVYANAAVAKFANCDKSAAIGKGLMDILSIEENHVALTPRRGYYPIVRPVIFTPSQSTERCQLLVVPVGGGARKHSNLPYTVVLVYEDGKDDVREYVDMLLLILPQMLA
eukprot:gene29861-36053_t